MSKKFMKLSFLLSLCCMLGVISYTKPAQAVLTDEESERVGSMSVKQRSNSLQRKDERLAERIRLIHQSFETYGSRRIHTELKNSGETCSRKRVTRLMKENGIEAKVSQHFNKTTSSRLLGLEDSQVSSQAHSVEGSQNSWMSYVSSPIKRVAQKTYDIVDYTTRNPYKAMVIGTLAYQVAAVAAQQDYRCVGVCLNNTWGYIGPCWGDRQHCASICSIMNCDDALCLDGCKMVYCTSPCSNPNLSTSFLLGKID